MASIYVRLQIISKINCMLKICKYNQKEHNFLNPVYKHGPTLVSLVYRD